MTVQIKEGHIVVILPINADLPLSSTGKSKMLASSGGAITAVDEKGNPVMFNGKPVKVNVSAYIPAK